MKKNPKKIALMGLAASVLFGATACGSNRQPAVYGPAPNPDDNTTEITTEVNEEPAVYGPPEWFDEEADPVTESDNDNDQTETTEEITVEDNEPEEVYGPPVGEE